MTASRKLVLLSVVALSTLVVASVPGASIASGAVPVPPNYVGAPGLARGRDSRRRPSWTTCARRSRPGSSTTASGGYRVAEVSAFTNSDYIVVQTRNGADAFELLASPGAGWLMLSPPSMLWNKRYGMARSWETNWSGSGMMPALMGGGRAAGQWNGWFDTGAGLVETPAAAMAAANRWLARAHPGERATSLRSFPGYVTHCDDVPGQEGRPDLGELRDRRRLVPRLAGRVPRCAAVLLGGRR